MPSSPFGRLAPALALAAIAYPAFLHAQVSTWTIDPAHSAVDFQIRHLGVANVRGSLSGVTGVVQLDEKEITHSAVEAKIQSSTIHTNDEKRDAHLRGEDFFNVDKYPSILFTSSGLTLSKGKLQMIGDLTLGGQTKPVTLDVDGPATPQGIGGKMVSGFSATGTLSRKAFNFGEKYGSPLIGDEIKFTIDIEMTKN